MVEPLSGDADESRERLRPRVTADGEAIDQPSGDHEGDLLGACRSGIGEGVRCVVSVAMLAEGWDANTVTHIVVVDRGP